MGGTIKLVFDGDRVKIEVDGVVGGDCKSATEAIEAALGLNKGTEYKPEFSQQQGTEQQQ